MVSGETLGLAVAALAAGEASGVTNFTGASDKSDKQPLGSGGPTFDLSGLRLGAGRGGGGGGVDAGALAQAFQAGASTGVGSRSTVPSGLGGLVERARSAATQASGAARDAQEAAEVATSTTTAVTSTLDKIRRGAFPGGNPTGRSRGAPAFDTSTSEAFDFQDYAGGGGYRGVLADLGELGAQGGKFGRDAGKFVSDNPIATAGAGLGVLAAPFTGGASIPVGLAVGGGVGEVGADLATGQYGDPKTAAASAYDNVAGVADELAGGSDEFVGATVSGVGDLLGGNNGARGGQASSRKMNDAGSPSGRTSTPDATTADDAGKKTEKKVAQLRKTLNTAGASATGGVR